MDIFLVWKNDTNTIFPILKILKCATASINDSNSIIECSRNGRYAFIKMKTNGSFSVCGLQFNGGMLLFNHNIHPSFI